MAQPDSVRLAVLSDAATMADLQRQAWALRSPGLALPDDIEDTWRLAIAKPPLAQCRVLVATEGQQVVGFAAINPSGDPDARHDIGEVSEFIAEGPHADRLLHACVDTLVQDGFTLARWWLPSTDDVRRSWLAETGWVSDGAHQELAEDGVRLKLVRLHTSLT